MTLEEYISLGAPAIASLFPGLTSDEYERLIDRLRPYQVHSAGKCLDSCVSLQDAQASRDALAADGRYGSGDDLVVVDARA